MFADLALALLAASAAQQITIPLGKPPRQVERPRAPIAETGPRWAAECQGSQDWERPAPPVRIHGNTYLVGTCGISAILIAGSDGHVLIDAGTEAGADLVAANVRSLGFRLSDIRYILHSHEHYDHVGGLARLQQLTGATVVASEPAATVLASGVAGRDDPQAGVHKPFSAASVGRIIGDGQDIRLGNLRVTAIATPGHTPGALSWRWISCDGGVCRTLVYADSLTPVSHPAYRFSDHPDRLAAYRQSLARVAASPCEILLTPHPSASDLPGRLARGRPLLDEGACRAYAERLGKALDERLGSETPGK